MHSGIKKMQTPSCNSSNVLLECIVFLFFNHKGVDKMNKAELIDAVAKSTKQTKTNVEETLNALMAAVQTSLVKGENVQLIGFGTFAVEARAARIGRNPATGKELKIPAKKVAKFKVGSKLKDAVAGMKKKK
jgi:DNA-binding protein HU-beta